MTREEAKDNLIGISSETGNPDYVDFFSCENLIDTIYDNFESRICENCKAYNGCSILDSLIFANEHENLEYEDFKNFGCNNFKRKEK